VTTITDEEAAEEQRLEEVLSQTTAEINFDE
jgi:hypothetical protein